MKTIIGIIVFMMLLVVSATNVFAFTTHKFELNILSPDLILIDSFPEKYNDIPKKGFPHALLNFTRKNGTWDERPMAAGIPDCQLCKETFERIASKIKALQNAIDSILRPNVLVSFSYIICYEDAVICINDNHIPEKLRKDYQESICVMMNIKRYRAIEDGF